MKESYSTHLNLFLSVSTKQIWKVSVSVNLQSKIYRIFEYPEFRNICIALSHIDDRYLKISINHLLLQGGEDWVSPPVYYMGAGNCQWGHQVPSLLPCDLARFFFDHEFLPVKKKKWESMHLTGLLWRVNETTDVWVVTQSTPLWCFSMHLFPFKVHNWKRKCYI